MGFRTYEIDTLIEFMEKELSIGPLDYQLRHMIALDLGLPISNVVVRKRDDGEWDAMVKVMPRQYISISFDRPAPEAQE